MPFIYASPAACRGCMSVCLLYTSYVFEADEMIQGFVGLNDEYIEGIFVAEEMQSCGIGKLLVDYVKDKKVAYD